MGIGGGGLGANLSPCSFAHSNLDLDLDLDVDLDLDRRLLRGRNRRKPATSCIKHTERSRGSAGRENTLVQVHV